MGLDLGVNWDNSISACWCRPKEDTALALQGLCSLLCCYSKAFSSDERNGLSF